MSAVVGVLDRYELGRASFEAYWSGHCPVRPGDWDELGFETQEHYIAGAEASIRFADQLTVNS